MCINSHSFAQHSFSGCAIHIIKKVFFEIQYQFKKDNNVKNIVVKAPGSQNSKLNLMNF